MYHKLTCCFVINSRTVLLSVALYIFFQIYWEEHILYLHSSLVKECHMNNPLVIIQIYGKISYFKAFIEAVIYWKYPKTWCGDHQHYLKKISIAIATCLEKFDFFVVPVLQRVYWMITVSSIHKSVVFFFKTGLWDSQVPQSTVTYHIPRRPLSTSSMHAHQCIGFKSRQLRYHCNHQISVIKFRGFKNHTTIH